MAECAVGVESVKVFYENETFCNLKPSNRCSYKGKGKETEFSVEKVKETFVEEILLENYDKYYRMALYYVKDTQDALDVVQEAAYKAIFKAEKVKNIKYADTWICRIIINEAMEFLRKNRKNYTDIAECEIEVNDEYENLELAEAIQKLPHKDQTIILLRFFEGMSLDEVAQIMDENLSTIKSRLYRALKKLKLQLTEE
ncbi:MAG: sigma-70 family RNA polymerase sigma factor [Lachnospiraceae bacterium]|nr:sigma-70 family RNA polymerase sigma factor [Lachnospiraceae bacterium]